MINEKIVDALNDVDDILISASMPGSISPQSVVRSNRRVKTFRILKAACFALCVCLVFGGVAYATGLISFFSENEKGGIAVETVTVNDGDMSSVSFKMYATNVLKVNYPSVLPKDLKGDITKLPADEYSEVHYAHRGFDTQKEAMEFIGYKKLEAPWYPYETSKTSVLVSGPSGDFDTVWVQTVSKSEDLPPELSGWLEVRSELFMAVSREQRMETQTIQYDNYKEVIKHVSPKGYEYYVLTRDEEADFADIAGAKGRSSVCGVMLKNDIYYMITIDFDAKTRDEAYRILDLWAEN